MADNVISVVAVIGRRIKQLRTERDRTQEDIATEARTFGFPWGRSSISAIESGTYDLSAGELLMLPVILDRALDCPITLEDLLVAEPREIVRLGGDCGIYGDSLATLASGDTDEVAAIGHTHFPESPLMNALLEPPDPELKRLWPRASFAQLFNAQKYAGGEAEQKAARKLGMPATQVAVAAWRIWGRSLSAQRDLVVSERAPEVSGPSRQAMRGRVTRQLVEQLAAYIKSKES